MNNITICNDLLDDSLLDSILNDPLIMDHRQCLGGTNKMIRFSYPLSDDLRRQLMVAFPMDLSHLTSIPMKWVCGDQHPHIDRGSEEFQKTCLLYLTDSPGSLSIEEQPYEIRQNTGYVFENGLEHGTIGTENIARLMMGPMSEMGMAVGFVGVQYFNDDTFSSSIQYDDSGIFLSSSILTVSPPSGTVFGGWLILSSSDPAYPTGAVAQPGDLYDIATFTIQAGPYWVAATSSATICFGADTQILCFSPETFEEHYKTISDIRKNDLIKTCRDGYKKVEMIGTSKLYNPGNNLRSKNRLYKCSKDQYPELTSDLFLTGCHSILVRDFSIEERGKTMEMLGKICITDQHYRLMACIDQRAKPYEKEGLYDIWHLALENDDYYSNYGIYANGLLVETTSKRMLKELSGMDLIE